MEALLLYFFRERPEVISAYYKYRPVLINMILLVTLATAILSHSEKVRSLSLGLAVGVVLVNIGESVARLRGNNSKKVHGSTESVNG